MRVAVVTESFLPQVNGVTNSVLKLCEHLPAHGVELLVVAPGAGPAEWAGVPVVRTPSCRIPGYRSFRLALPFPALGETLRRFAPDVVHLASPAMLGAQAATVAQQAGIPFVAVYQTDLGAYADRYGFGVAEPAVWRRLARIHAGAALTLAPSRAAARQLEQHGVPRVSRWGRGVDLRRFSPLHRDGTLRHRWSPDGELVVGYVGRLAHEKEVHLLAGVQDLPGVRLVVVGDGPLRRQLERCLPRAHFTGQLTGEALARAYASFDVFAHTGAHETFCQAAQEALASGVPVVAPAAGGPLDLVQPGENGLLFEPGSAAHLAECVSVLQGVPEIRALMGRQARRSVEGRSWEVVVAELVRQYRDVVAGAASVPGSRAA
jgi:phosphatidylinositol alpha 1,6-mannosyltransferase